MPLESYWSNENEAGERRVYTLNAKVQMLQRFRKDPKAPPEYVSLFQNKDSQKAEVWGRIGEEGPEYFVFGSTTINNLRVRGGSKTTVRDTDILLLSSSKEYYSNDLRVEKGCIRDLIA